MPQLPNAADVSTYGPPLDPIAPLRVALRGHYEIEREIGQGAYATVYLARDLKHERPVALKVLHADLASSLGPERFQREIKLAARLQHPHILSVYDSGASGGQLAWGERPARMIELRGDRPRHHREVLDVR